MMPAAALRRRYGRAKRPAPPNFDRYRDTPADPDAVSPLHQFGSVNAHRVGAYWTVPVAIRVSDLAGLRAVVQHKPRLQSVRAAVESGVELPPIEIGVSKGGGGELIDGNHRLAEARKSGREMIRARFTFAGT